MALRVHSTGMTLLNCLTTICGTGVITTSRIRQDNFTTHAGELRETQRSEEQNEEPPRTQPQLPTSKLLPYLAIVRRILGYHWEQLKEEHITNEQVGKEF